MADNALPPDAPSQLVHLQALFTAGHEGLAGRIVHEVHDLGCTLPIHAFTLGNPDPAAPALGVFGGVHGLERIGAEVAVACLHSIVARLRWDDSLQRLLEGLRLVFMPLVNPGGMWRGTRANPQGVDLMRNAPIDCAAGAPFLVGGQRLSPVLPWYRGPAGAPMQPEAQALCDLVERELLGRPFVITVDCHSGFGPSDRRWFPYAHSPRPIEHLAELHALGELLDESMLHHRYLFEPQSRQYLAHGDLWDHLCRRAIDGGSTLLPLTLEMFVAVGEEEPAPDVQPPRHLQPADRTPPAAGAAPAPGPARLPDARRPQPCPLGPGRCGARAAACAGARALVPSATMSTWILLRGWTRETAHWGRFPAQIEATLPDAEVVCLDLPGTGGLHREPSPARVDAMVEACRAQLASAGHTPPWHLIGLSLGGMVAAGWAAAHRDEIAGCVLINASMRGAALRRLRPGSWGTLLCIAAVRDARQAEAGVLRLTSNAAPAATLVADWAAIRRARPVSAANAVRQLLAAARFRLPPRPVGLPVLVLASAADRLVDPRRSHALAQRWQAELALHPTAGHDLPLDEGAWVAARLRDWVAARSVHSTAQSPA